jgi:osmotically inducible protein OsmC
MPRTLTTISATNTGGRNGKGVTSDNRITIDFAGKDPAKNTPEHMFALGYSACFSSAIQAVAGIKKITLPPDYTVTVTVPLIMGDDHGYSIEAHLKVSIPGMDKAAAKELVETAHTVCPYSKATRNNIPVTLEVA